MTYFKQPYAAFLTGQKLVFIFFNTLNKHLIN